MHQPNYLPWLGFFNKINLCDVFVLLDVVQMPRGQSVANRNKILTPNGEHTLTVPISKHSGPEGKFTYQQALYAEQSWRDKHLKTIQFAYKKAKYYAEVYPLIEEIINNENLFFCDLNCEFIQMVCKQMVIKTELIKLSSILQTFGQKNDLILDIAKAINANVYLCGQGGGLEYTDPNLLNPQGVQIAYTSFKHPVYEQVGKQAFVSHLSIIDYLFNCGFTPFEQLVASNP